MILGIDLGTTAVKAVFWGTDGPVATGRAGLVTDRPGPDRVEQDPRRWWPAVVTAVGRAGAGLPGGSAVGAIGFSTQRQSIVPVTAGLDPLGPALMWSDRRAGDAAPAVAARAGGEEAVRRRTGSALDGSSVAARLAWLAGSDPALPTAARWVLGPRELVAARLTGEVATDTTVASRSGLYDTAGGLVAGLAGEWQGHLPPVREPDHHLGDLLPGPAAELGLAPGTPVVLGAGDRACEVLGVGATARRPMTSWGTTANLSVPLAGPPDPVPAGLAVSRAVGGGFLLEGGLSGAGSLVDWLAALTGTDAATLAGEAAAAVPGAGGVVLIPWIDGARAPWGVPEVGAAALGLTAAHGRGDLARAAYEAVAFELARCLEAAAPAGSGAPGAEALYLCGGGAVPPWPGILAGVTGVPVLHRASAEAGSLGAALIAARAVGEALDLERVNPVIGREDPDPGLAAAYAALREGSDRAAASVMSLFRAAPR